MRQEFFNLELKTNGQKLYEFTDQTIDWINKNNFNNGILNLILLNLGITSEPLQLLYNQYAVIMGIVYTYLPLMILPLYGYLNKFDLNLIEASKDLGLNRFKTFFKVILPLSVPGIVAGSLLVFIPVVGEFIIPEMLGGSDRLYYGKILWDVHPEDINKRVKY